SALEFTVEEARRSLEAARVAQASELEKAARGHGGDLERLLERVQDVEQAVARRHGDLERRTVESGAALEDLLGRVGELARASNALGRAAAVGDEDTDHGGPRPRSRPTQRR